MEGMTVRNVCFDGVSLLGTDMARFEFCSFRNVKFVQCNRAVFTGCRFGPGPLELTCCTFRGCLFDGVELDKLREAKFYCCLQDGKILCRYDDCDAKPPELDWAFVDCRSLSPQHETVCYDGIKLRPQMLDFVKTALARQGLTRQDLTRQDLTRQDLTRQELQDLVCALDDPHRVIDLSFNEALYQWKIACVAGAEKACVRAAHSMMLSLIAAPRPVSLALNLIEGDNWLRPPPDVPKLRAATDSWEVLKMLKWAQESLRCWLLAVANPIMVPPWMIPPRAVGKAETKRLLGFSDGGLNVPDGDLVRALPHLRFDSPNWALCMCAYYGRPALAEAIKKSTRRRLRMAALRRWLRARPEHYYDDLDTNKAAIEILFDLTRTINSAVQRLHRTWDVGALLERAGFTLQSMSDWPEIKVGEWCTSPLPVGESKRFLHMAKQMLPRPDGAASALSFAQEVWDEAKRRNMAPELHFGVKPVKPSDSKLTTDMTLDAWWLEHNNEPDSEWAQVTKEMSRIDVNSKGILLSIPYGLLPYYGLLALAMEELEDIRDEWRTALLNGADILAARIHFGCALKFNMLNFLVKVEEWLQTERLNRL